MDIETCLQRIPQYPFITDSFTVHAWTLKHVFRGYLNIPLSQIPLHGEKRGKCFKMPIYKQCLSIFVFFFPMGSFLDDNFRMT